MNSSVNKSFLRLTMVCFVIFLMNSPLHAANVKVATVPMADATTTNVLPNLMFVLDNSGSMAQEYTPDYMSDIQNTPATNDKQCRDSGDDDIGIAYSGAVNGSTRVLDVCIIGDPPFANADMNSQYYNPAIRYTAGVNADGSSRGDQSDPANVKTDSYGKHNITQLLTTASAVNIATGYPDRVWCTTQLPSNSDLTDPSTCRKNSDYLYPNSIFKYGRFVGSAPDQRVTAVSLTGVIKVTGAPYYYSVVPTEYCKAVDLKDCTLSSIPTGTYIFPAKSRWCDSANLTNCQSVKAGSFVFPRYIGVGTTTAVAASGSVTLNSRTTAQGTSGRSVTSIKVGTVEILNATVTGAAGVSSAAFATNLANQINTYASSPEFTATASGDVITITSTQAAGASANGTVTYTSVGSAVNGKVNTTGGVSGVQSKPPYTFARTDIQPATASYSKAVGRTDCVGANCTYLEEVTNFGNWYAYYRTRMQAMKTSASLAFKPIDNGYRVGFITIANQGSNYLPIDKFDAGTNGQKDNWYKKLFATTASTSTPLRSALSIVGRIYAGKKPIGTSDPVQYSCQQNFTLLTTDGYWNSDSASDVKDINGDEVGNRDGGATTRPMYEGTVASTNSLADVAKYFYDQDIRDAGFNNCTGALGLDVCENNVFLSPSDNNNKQHMTTFTMGLGVDGTLLYTGDYQTAISGDFADIKNGVKNWSVPAADSETAVDDLWHAAVNGHGQYFSVKDPAQLINGLKDALASISSKVGTGGGATTSSLQPITGQNYAYVGSYTTSTWTGNIERRDINTTTLDISQSASKCVEDLIASSCASPSSIQQDSGTGAYYCVTPNATSTSCTSSGGFMDGTDCKVSAAPSCIGTLKSKVSASTDTRLIKMKDPSSTGLTDFLYSNLSSAQKSSFETTFLASNLSQWNSFTSTQKTAAVGVNFINYLRGQFGYENRASINSADRLFRYRQTVLGDVTESQPTYMGGPTFNYTDAGYTNFKTSNTSRAGTVYVGANDGMLHAFAADTLEERWTFIPTPVIPNLWKLADNNYSSQHTNYVNGDPYISDIAIGSSWKTVLIGGLNSGGRGYYALDISNPLSPQLLWEFNTTNDVNLGYTFGEPVITKLNNGTWVVLLTSGYNNGSLDNDGVTSNAPSGNGVGYLYVVNAQTGSLIRKISTGVGDAATPSGLTKVTTYVDDPTRNNTAVYAYAGDLLGNLWRFDINAGTKVLIATLKDTAGNIQPITVRPTTATIDGVRVIYVGTGKYLELSDLTNLQQQTLYAITDPYNTDSSVVTLTNPRADAGMKQQTLTTSGVNRVVTSNGVNLPTDRGWYINLPDSGERQNLTSRIILGTLLVPTLVPSSTVCAPGGYGYFNYLDYKTGAAIAGNNNIASEKTSSATAGFTIIYGADGKPVIVNSQVNGNTYRIDKPFPVVSSGFNSQRVIWRELTQ